MSATTVLPLRQAEPECPSWCAREAHAEAMGSHLSAPVRLNAPGGTSPDPEVPLLSVQIGLGYEEEVRGERPRAWLSTVDGTGELDPGALESFTVGLEDFALRLRGLRHRYETVVLGGVPEAVDLYPEATHPLELVAPCPPWCQYRNQEEHCPTGLLVEQFHAPETEVMELELRPVIHTKYGREAETLELGMTHNGHAPLPHIDLTLGTTAKWHYVQLTFEEADRLRTRLSELLAQGREYARPEGVASLRELVDYCGVRIVEHQREVEGFHGHAVGDTRNGGPVWVTVPRGTVGPRLEETVKDLLAEIHETQAEVTAQDGEEVRQAGAPPEISSWSSSGQAAA
ncbi:hypothetical protein E0L36_26920 [Streptomyces sp. AJS327]|uniref:DUF6907 domain-containing protein n=1 Tax=Streptomyces sp. AJS327 TaxID=2545265 RepID=UPI0015DF2BA5|nr:hypothetical protein [Streptomyces sp. AJS327]MBA0054348.1 hypothetical protein [Streptomyces sp. AJS327]